MPRHGVGRLAPMGCLECMTANDPPVVFVLSLEERSQGLCHCEGSDSDQEETDLLNLVVSI